MFKKLRNRLLITNMIIIAALLFASFSVIFAMTYSNVLNGINAELDRAMQINRRSASEFHPVGEGHIEPPEAEKRPPEDGEKRREFAPTVIVKLDNDGNILSVNSMFTIENDFYSGETAKIISNIEAGKDASGTVRGENGVWEYRAEKTPDGYSIAFLEVSAERAFLRNLIIALLLVMIAALTAALLISLNIANRSIKPIEDSYNKQKQFVADASHELKTPLTTINTNVDVLLSRGDTDAEERKWLGYVKDETERMTKLTNDLLCLARLDHSENSVIMSRVSFSEAVESVILTMEAVAFEKNISLSYSVAPNIFVMSSSEQLKQLVIILLDNALKYTPKGGSVEINLSAPAVLTVKNTGEGISAEDCKQIFERFYRSDKSRARGSGGYGLGLAIAKSIAESAKGTITASSKLGEYTKFTVKLPQAK